MITTELLGPIIYYYIFDGNSYRTFSDKALGIYYLIAIFSSCIIFFLINSKHTVKLKSFSFEKRGGERSLFYVYTIFTIGIVLFYVFQYRHQLLLVNVLKGNTKDLSRSDTSGLIPHWYTISSLISLIIPSFYFYFYKKIHSEKIQFILFFGVAVLTMIDGNKALFVYLVLFMFLYIYKLKINKYIVMSIFTAFFLYFMLKGGDFTKIGAVVQSAVRRFFVTQGACFINRIQMVLDGYDFSMSPRISTDVFRYMYHYNGGAAPTVFWGDIFVKYGITVVFLVIILTNWMLYRCSQYIYRAYSNNNFIYWAYTSIAYMICMSELSIDHLLRIFIVIINCIIFLATVGKKQGLQRR